jgi:chlorobactene glucosyltransferase
METLLKNLEQKISVLIPARNEEKNISACIESLVRLDPPADEILILDDQSTDQTASLVQQYAEIYPNIRLISGKPLPQGWLGKNWACHQLSEDAAGDILIFTDADNTHHPHVLKKTMGWMDAYNLDFLSAFPQQSLRSLSEKMVVPVVDMFVYSMLPLWLTFYSPYSSLSAANGQWMVFRKKAYRKMGGHVPVASEVVEDVALARLAKRSGLKILTLSGTHAVFGRMYNNALEVKNGFTKNLFGLTGFHTGLFFLVFSILIFTMILPFPVIFFNQTSAARIAVFLNLIIRFFLVTGYRHPPLVSIVLHPFTVLYTAGIALNSWISHRKGTVVWKDRLINKGSQNE